MSKRAYILGAAVALGLSTGAVAQTSGSTGTNSPTGANSRAATSPGLPDRPDPMAADKAQAKADAKKAKKQMKRDRAAHSSMTDPR